MIADFSCLFIAINILSYVFNIHRSYKGLCKVPLSFVECVKKDIMKQHCEDIFHALNYNLLISTNTVILFLYGSIHK